MFKWALVYVCEGRNNNIQLSQITRTAIIEVNSFIYIYIYKDKLNEIVN